MPKYCTSCPSSCRQLPILKRYVSAPPRGYRNLFTISTFIVTAPGNYRKKLFLCAARPLYLLHIVSLMLPRSAFLIKNGQNFDFVLYITIKQNFDFVLYPDTNTYNCMYFYITRKSVEMQQLFLPIERILNETKIYVYIILFNKFLQCILCYRKTYQFQFFLFFYKHLASTHII